MGDRGTYIPDAAEQTATESERAAVLMKREAAAREWDDEIARNHAALLERIKAPHGLIEELVERFDYDRNGDDDPVLLAAEEYLANPPADARQIVKALLDTLSPVWTDEKAKALKDAQAFVDGVAAPVGVNTQRGASEFIATWFEGAQKWVVLFPDGTALDGGFGAIGYATNAAYDHTGLGESDFEVTEDTGTFYRYERSES